LTSQRSWVVSERGDTLIEVMISAVILGLIVIATLAGLDNTNRATAQDRARSQADELAQQDEEQLRSASIKKLDELTSHSEEREVTENGTVYTIITSATAINDSTATASCTSSTGKVDYLQTNSEVTWASRGNAKPVVETGIVSPPADSALIVQVGEAATPLPGALVVATGPKPAATTYELETSEKGCAILAIPPGEYNIDVSKTGYVDQNGYPHTQEDASGSVTRTIYVPAETTSSKLGYNIGLAGQLETSFVSSSSATTGDSFVAYETGMTKYRPFTTSAFGTYESTIKTPTTIYPFTSAYTVYAGSCESDKPSASVIEANKSNFQVTVPRGKTAAITTIEPPVNILVKTGKSATEPGETLTTATGSTTDGCAAKRSFTSTPGGSLAHPGLPFGAYTMCVSSAVGSRKWEGKFENNSVNGPLVSAVITPPNNGTVEKIGSTNYGVIYLGTNPSGTPSKTSTGVCT
jgi:Tfp pilus assembly protein PilV